MNLDQFILSLSEKKLETFPAVKKFVNYNAPDKGTAEFAAETGWVIDSFGIEHFGFWGTAGYSLRKGAAGQNTVSMSDITREFSSLFKAIAESQKSSEEKEHLRVELEEVEKLLLKNAQTMQTSHSIILVDWDVKSDGNFFDRKRGMIDLILWISLLPQMTPETVQTALNLCRQRIA